MKKMYIISICDAYINDTAVFHFKGFYLGNRIKEVRVKNCYVVKGECYLLKLKKPVVRQQVLYAYCEKQKKLF